MLPGVTLIQHKMSKKQIVPQEEDKNCQENINMRPVKSKVCADKKCQATKCYKKTSDVWPVKPEMNVQLPKPAVLYQYRRLSKDKKCQSTVCEYDDFESQSKVKMCSDKICQENINMQPVMPDIMNVQLPKPAVLCKCRRLCSDKNCQSTRCCKKKSPMRPVHTYDRNCQSV